MYFKQFYLGCLAHASYFIGSEGEAAVVDPQRDVDQYLTEAEALGYRIKYVVETHLHADFVSGHRELAELTGAEIVFGKAAGALFPHRAVSDGDELKIGTTFLRFIETPGHTPEGVCILVSDTGASELPRKVLTGDTLFIGDVGRPDLAGSRGYTTEQMAGLLYESLHSKLLTLDDDVEVYPAHGAGSMCGRNISKETSSTIGQQRRFNPALAPMSKDDFIRMMTTDLSPAPQYFSHDAELNRVGAPALGELPRPRAMTPAEVRSCLRDENCVVLDVRTAAEFGAYHVSGSLNIGLSGQFASWAGILIPHGSKLVIVANDEAQVSEAVKRLARVGLEPVEGFLAGGMDAWRDEEFETFVVTQIAVDELHDFLEEGHPVQVLDVRRPAEYEGGHVPGARLVTLSDLASHPLDDLDPQLPVAVICAGGYRSSAATSILARRGFRDLYNVTGGTTAYVEAGYPVEKSEAA